MAATLFDSRLPGPRLAYLRDGPDDDMGRTGFLWLGGFKSEMTGSKAEALADLARATRRPGLRFDYSGHGQSEGMFTDGTISRWLDQAIHMFLTHTKGRRIVVGSSMGGWLALLLAKALKREDPPAFQRIAGLVLIAPATDMTRDLMWEQFPPGARAALRDSGVWQMPNDYGSPYPITARLIEDGESHLLLQDGLSLPFPVRILQGSEDRDVTPAHAVKTFEALEGADITLTFIKGGDHRLSTPGQLAVIRETVLRLAEKADGVSV
jgi:pimeloyl-ACP methyl ester carboxylesterase